MQTCRFGLVRKIKTNIKEVRLITYSENHFLFTYQMSFGSFASPKTLLPFQSWRANSDKVTVHLPSTPTHEVDQRDFYNYRPRAKAPMDGGQKHLQRTAYQLQHS